MRLVQRACIARFIATHIAIFNYYIRKVDACELEKGYTRLAGRRVLLRVYSKGEFPL